MGWFEAISHYSFRLARNSDYGIHIKKKTGKTPIPQLNERPIYINLIDYKLADVFKAFKITGIYVNSEAKYILTYIK